MNIAHISYPSCIQLLSRAERKSTVGIECGKWDCALKGRRAPKDGPKITFYTWDFAGQVIEVMLATKNPQLGD